MNKLPVSPAYARLGAPDPEVCSVRGDTESENEGLLEKEVPQRPQAPNRRYQLVLWLNGTIFVLSLFLFAMTASIIRGISDPNQLLRQTSEYSPIFDQLEIPLIRKKMNATLLEPEPLPIYRQPPSPEVDEAWNRLANIKPIAISRDDVVKLGRDPEQAAKWPASFGFGSDAYIGRLDVFHQIHCLDWLRREAYFDHYYGKKWPPGTRPSDMHRTHISHCIYLLLQNLMCNANVDIYTHYWADAQLNAFPDFSVNHQCRDFDAILRWQEENSVDVDEFAAIRKPPDAEARVMSHRFKELFGWYNANPDDGSDSGIIG
ncbi:oxidase ustYa family protein [Aspergillus saccharolyticus JOP 1030-1]|uniref:Tat pathway signal sequence n=1 Tax=Aspergillus saccharolyticus JOP 1030-1 TaxID=1450539 RepID=A0A318ZIP4_9EURO|nr:hypothetical protein BP01DRAFT_364982 [Aspergillus saccharolyticus JOP 1030-1]PYH46214.1 hypothetical protein BP01DRAFT_364982 [Aspergillus saccharolyticus JOP 1030-1]